MSRPIPIIGQARPKRFTQLLERFEQETQKRNELLESLPKNTKTGEISVVEALTIAEHDTRTLAGYLRALLQELSDREKRGLS